VPVSPPRCARQAALIAAAFASRGKPWPSVGRDSVTLATLPSRSTISTDDATSETQRKGREQLHTIIYWGFAATGGTAQEQKDNCRTVSIVPLH
jgi:hypothetical protein